MIAATAATATMTPQTTPSMEVAAAEVGLANCGFDDGGRAL